MQAQAASSRRVLIADDDPLIRPIITRFVEREGYEAVVVNDGSAAYRLLQKDSNFCGAIFDVATPQLEELNLLGFMTAEERLKRVPIMMITSKRELRLNLATGVTVFLPKHSISERFQTTFRLLVAGVKPVTRTDSPERHEITDR